MMADLISRLSELRCQYNCFDENERDAYHTLSEAIKALSDVPDTNVGDTISRQAAIDAFRKELCREREYIIPFKGCERVLGNVPSADVQQVTRWIPCSEQMPEHIKEFLLTVVPNPKYPDYRMVTIGRWWVWADDKGAFDCIKPTNINGAIYNLCQPIPANQVLAWMPKPEPYKDGGTDE